MNPKHLLSPRNNGGTRTPFLTAFLAICEALKWTSNVNQIWQTAKLPQNQKLNNLNELWNLSHSWRLVLLCKTHWFAIFRKCTFLYLSILGDLSFYLCFDYLQKYKTLPHAKVHIYLLTSSVFYILFIEIARNWGFFTFLQFRCRFLRNLTEAILKENMAGVFRNISKGCQDWFVIKKISIILVSLRLPVLNWF